MVGFVKGGGMMKEMTVATLALEVEKQLRKGNGDKM